MGDRRKGGTRGRDRIKEAQLCAQVRETLSLALAETPEEDLLELFVLDVTPAPDSSRLAVHVEAPKERDPAAVRTRLSSIVGRLRAAVASSIHRKKVPSLTFVVIPRA